MIKRSEIDDEEDPKSHKDSFNHNNNPQSRKVSIHALDSVITVNNNELAKLDVLNELPWEHF